MLSPAFTDMHCINPVNLLFTAVLAIRIPGTHTVYSDQTALPAPLKGFIQNDADRILSFLNILT